MKCHPICELMPELSAADYAALKADMDKHGQRSPILLHAGLVIDGRHRDRICGELKIKPWYEKAKLKDGESLVEFVFSLNFHRRHLSQSQKAAVAVAMLPMLEDEAKDRQRAGGTGQQARPASKGKASEQAAKMTGVSTRYVEKAKQIKDEDPEKFEQVKKGDVTITAAQDAKPRSNPVQVKDGLGRVISDPKLLPAFSDGVDQLDALMQRTSDLKREIKELAGQPLGVFLTFSQIEADLNCVRSALKFAKPYAPCVYCAARGCKACRNTGWLGQDMYEQAPKELKP